MTAINPARLKKQIAETKSHFREPGEFIVQLHKLFNYYADRVRRMGQSGSSPPSLPAYHVPLPVMRSLVRELTSLLERSPSRGLLLVDALWVEEWLEMRLLAAWLLGKIPALNPGPIRRRVLAWLATCQEKQIRRALMDQSLESLRERHFTAVTSLLDTLMEEGKRDKRQAVLYGLQGLINQEGFSNLPLIFNHLKSILGKMEGLRGDIVPLIRGLIPISERECFYFLQKQFPTAAQPQMTRVIRQCLNDFSADYQQQLRQLLRRTAG